MPEIDRITAEGKNAIIAILNKSLQVEYGMIMNYPRLMDQIININESKSQDFILNVEHLGKDSFRHATEVAKMIENLGGEPQWEMVVIDRMIDIESMLVEQLGKEKLAMSFYKEARLIAQNNQEKAKGYFNRLRGVGGETREGISRSEVIRILTNLESDEWSHFKRIENALISMDIKTDMY
jgi:bacterioferritin (cytochrome b1)